MNENIYGSYFQAQLRGWLWKEFQFLLNKLFSGHPVVLEDLKDPENQDWRRYDQLLGFFHPALRTSGASWKDPKEEIMHVLLDPESEVNRHGLEVVSIDFVKRNVELKSVGLYGFVQFDVLFPPELAPPRVAVPAQPSKG